MYSIELHDVNNSVLCPHGSILQAWGVLDTKDPTGTCCKGGSISWYINDPLFYAKFGV